MAVSSTTNRLANETFKKTTTGTVTVTEYGTGLAVQTLPSGAAPAQAAALGANKFVYGLMVDINQMSKWSYMGGEKAAQGTDALKARLEGAGWGLLREQENENAYGFVAVREEGGRKQIAINFRGTSDMQDVINYDIQKSFNGKLFETYYQKLKGLVDFVAENAGQYDNVLVGGHSLGGGAAQWAVEDLIKAGVSESKIVGATIGSPGLGIDTFDIHQTYTTSLYQFEQQGHGTGDPVTLVPGQLGTMLDINFTPSLDEFYMDVFTGYGANFLNLHSGALYVESSIHMNYGDGLIANSPAQLAAKALTGGTGNDMVTGTDGSDLIKGGAGHDILIGGVGTDSLVDREGHNSFVYSNIGSAMTIQGGVADRILLPFGVTPDQVLYKAVGNDLVLTLTNGVDGQITVKDYYASDAYRVGKVGFVQADEGGLLEQQFADISKLDKNPGSLGSKLHLLDTDHDLIAGGSAADKLAGNDGTDRLYGYGGNDSLSGGKGVDWLEGGSGNDTLDGGTEKDFLFGGSGNDSLLGGDGADRLFGGSGNDRLAGGAGLDELTGGSGRDVYVINSLDEVDRIKDINFAEGDVLDLSALFGDNVTAANASNYVSFSAAWFSTETTVRIDLDGKAGGWFSTGWDKDATVMEGVSLDDDDFQQLVNQGQIIV